jgi:hypothetical protein
VSVVISNFARGRLFETGGRGTRIVGASAEEFESELNQREPEAVLDGYAPFCKLHVYQNWTETPCGVIKMTPDNETRLRSGYEARTPDELPVLNRWFEGITPPRADWLIVILYSREQMQREGEPIDADWGVVGCLATATPEEIPMAPITMMRNALGVDEGGSSVPLCPEAYRKSAEYWNTHANWRPDPPMETP